MFALEKNRLSGLLLSEVVEALNVAHLIIDGVIHGQHDVEEPREWALRKGLNGERKG
jgi:hypothetical protein